MVATVCASALALGSIGAVASNATATTASPTYAATQHSVVLPPAKAKFDYQLGGITKPADGIKMVVRDRKARIAPGLYNVCYINGFQTQESERSFWRKRQSLLLKRNGKPVVDSAWNERLLDIRTVKKRTKLANIVGRWIKGCARSGFQAVEFDNLDSWSRSKKMIKKSQARAYAKKLIKRAHHAGLAAGQKNWAELNGRKIGFNFALVEECGTWHECNRYIRYYGSHVYAVEYNRKSFNWSCKNYGSRISIVLRDRALSSKGIRAYC